MKSFTTSTETCLLINNVSRISKSTSHGLFFKATRKKSPRVGEPLHQKAKEKWETQQLRSQDKQVEEEHELSECKLEPHDDYACGCW